MKILLLGFNRPDLIRTTIENVIRLKGITGAYCVVDGARNADEQVLVDLCYDAFVRYKNNVNYSVEIVKRSENYGVKNNIIESITWFFNSEECGIIIEDDVIITQAFLDSISLLKSKNELHDCAAICAFQEHQYQGKNWYKSRYFQTWGWYSTSENWRRFLNHRQFYRYLLSRKGILDFHFNIFKIVFWGALYYQSYLRHPKKGTWDWAFCCSAWLANKSFLVPSDSYSANIGIGVNGTHSSKASYKSNVVPTDFVSSTLCSVRDQDSNKLLEEKRFYREVGYRMRYLPRYIFAFIRGYIIESKT